MSAASPGKWLLILHATVHKGSPLSTLPHKGCILCIKICTTSVMIPDIMGLLILQQLISHDLLL